MTPVIDEAKENTFLMVALIVLAHAFSQLNHRDTRC